MLLCIFARPILAMQAFDSIPVDHPVFNRYQALLNTPLSQKYSSPEAAKAADRYSMAVHLAQLQHSVQSQKEHLGPGSIVLMKTLVGDLGAELSLLGKDSEEMLLELATLEKSPARAYSTQKRPKKGQVELQSIEIEGTLRPRSQESYLKSLLNLTYAGLDQLDGYLKVSAREDIKVDGTAGTQTKINLHEALLDWRPRRFVNRVKAGKYRRHLGLGLLGNPGFEGLELIKQHQDYVLDFGVSRGFFASVESPFVLDIPLTVYTLSQTDSSQAGSLHSGLFLKKQWKNWGVSTEFVESHGDSEGMNGDSSAFSWLLEYHPSKTWSLKTSLTHTGDGFSTPPRGGWNPQEWNGISPSIQQEVLHSLSNYFGKGVGSTPGFSDMKVSLGLFGSGKNGFELHYDRLYDHSLTGINTDNGLELATLSLSRNLRRDASIFLRFQNLTWDSPGQSLSGFLRGKEKQDFNLIQSRIQFEF